VLVDPEPYEASEEQFSASLEQATNPPPPARFIPDQPVSDSPAPAEVPEVRAESEIVSSVPVAQTCDDDGSNSVATDEQDSGSWKDEVAARLNSYRARRKPRPPKYPSLALRFEPEPRVSPPPSIEMAALAAACAMPPVHDAEEVDGEPRTSAPVQQARQPAQIEEAPEIYPSARIIEFPRSYGPPEPSPDELAESICERPRILDDPEVELPPPALGGIMLETEQPEEPQPRPGLEIPLQPCPMSRRIIAAALDSVLVLSAYGVFGYIFLKLTKAMPAVHQTLPVAVVIAIALWTGYQYLLLTYSGSTPGLRLVKLRVSHFDGSAVTRRRRRWRVLASVLSGVSLGLGFAWCFLDEDSLCWHDRITHTYLAPSE